MDSPQGLGDDDNIGWSASNDADSFPTTCAFVFKQHPASGTLTIGCAVAAPRRRVSDTDGKAYQLSLYQFDDAEFSNLESVFVRNSPVTCHHPELAVDEAEALGVDDDEPEEQQSAGNGSKRQKRVGGGGNRLEKTLKHKLVSTLELLGITSKSHRIKALDIVDVTNDLQSLVGEEDMTPYRLKLNSPEWKLALQAAALLCRKEAFLSKEDLRGAFNLEFESLAAYMRLDAAAVTALNLLPSKEDKNRDFSVHGVLDKTVTRRLGSRLLSKWIRHPLIDADAIRKRQDRVEVLVNDTEVREAMRSALRGVPDLDQISKRFSGGRGGLEEVYVLYRFTEQLPALAECVQKLVSLSNSAEKDSIPFHDELCKLNELVSSSKFGQYREFVEDVLDLDLAPREFLIRAKHDDSGELERLAEERRDVDADMAKVVKRLLDNELADVEAKFETDPKMVRTHGHHFRVPKRHDSQLSSIKSGRTLLVVQACIRWTTPSLEELSDRRAEIVARQNQVQQKLVKEAMKVAATYLALIEMSASVVSELDVFASLAHVAATCPQGDYTRPSVSPMGTTGDVFLPSARHPCLELQPGISFVANTHEMNRETSRFQILTGPNMGGKSTFARQLGVICVMAQIGSFVPCAQGARLPVMDAVLARVGASDSQLRGISTFMAEMIEASNIVKACTDSSLVIIDELGRGTSTYDGFGLAWAISEHLAAERKAFVIFATHFHELTELASVVKGVCNLHVAAAVQPDGKVVMLHEVRQGQCDESFGVNIAKIAGFPEDVIEDATELLKKMDKFKGFEFLTGDATTESGEDAADETVRKKLRAFVEAGKLEDDDAFMRGAMEAIQG